MPNPTLTRPDDPRRGLGRLAPNGPQHPLSAALLACLRWRKLHRLWMGGGFTGGTASGALRFMAARLLASLTGSSRARVRGRALCTREAAIKYRPARLCDIARQDLIEGYTHGRHHHRAEDKAGPPAGGSGRCVAPSAAAVRRRRSSTARQQADCAHRSGHRVDPGMDLRNVFVMLSPVMLSPHQNAAVVNYLASHSSRPI